MSALRALLAAVLVATATAPAAATPGLSSGESYCQGDALRFQGDPGAVYDVREPGGPLVSQVRVHENGTGVLDTGGLNGSFALYDANGTPVRLDPDGQPTEAGADAGFAWRVEPALVASFDPDAVGGTDWPERTTMRVRFCDGERGPVEVTAADLNASQLARLFDGTPTDDGVRVAVPADGDVSVTLPAEFVGPHQFTVRRANASGSTTANLTVLAGHEPFPSFEGSVFETDPGGVAEIPVRFDADAATQTARVAVVGDDGLQMTLRVTNDGDDRATVRLDTGAFDGDSPAGAVTVADGGEVTVERAVPGDGFVPGSYDVNVSADGEEWDVGSLVVADETTATETTTADSTREGTGATATTGPGQPGFGVAAALAALAACAVAARRA